MSWSWSGGRPLSDTVARALSLFSRRGRVAAAPAGSVLARGFPEDLSREAPAGVSSGSVSPSRPPAGPGGGTTTLARVALFDALCTVYSGDQSLEADAVVDRLGDQGYEVRAKEGQ